MTVEPHNLVILVSDEHNRAVAGCYGHPLVKTPNIDRLAATGVRFANGYCSSPICVSARASMATGRYVHQIGAWDNSAAYDGRWPSWGHRLTAAGRTVTTIGKLHYRSARDDTGFPDQRLPMHIEGESGDVLALLRKDSPRRKSSRRRITDVAIGESPYTRFDTAVASDAVGWITKEAPRASGPWALFVSFASPHYPLVVPARFMDLYRPEDVPLPIDYGLAERPHHPVLDAFRATYDVDDEFDEPTIRRAIAAYLGLCTFMDEQVGRVLDALEQGGLADTTRIIYTSDHGDTLGDHGLWWKYTMYEGSAGVPFILSGPDLPHGRVATTNVSHVDVFPTALEATGTPFGPGDDDLPGRSLFGLIASPPTHRTVFGEYHAAGIDHRLLHDPGRSVQVRRIRRLPATALRPRGRSRRATRSGGAPGTRRTDRQHGGRAADDLRSGRGGPRGPGRTGAANRGRGRRGGDPRECARDRLHAATDELTRMASD